ncbi:MAG: NfeD family protein [Oscillospiraceae bacterium]|nr:NfeD family protein [Oscillospiraceae bacterium]
MGITGFWLVAVIIFAVVEAATLGLISVWFSFSALVSMAISALGGPLWLQIASFFAISLIVLAFLRPLARKHFTPRQTRTNADRVIGMTGIVIQPIDNLGGTGQVSVGGTVWTARSDDNATIGRGETVIILRIEGVKIFVRRVKEESGVPSS